MADSEAIPARTEDDRRFERLLAVERFRHEKWQAEVVAAQQRSWDAQKIAMHFAEIALQSAFLVNGGALIAIPPLMEWLSRNGRGAVPFDAAIFIVGLILAAAAAVVAYANWLFIAGHTAAGSDKRAVELRAEFFGGPIDKFELKKAQDNMSRRSTGIITTQVAAVALGVLSYVAFGYGAYTFIGLAHHNGEFAKQIQK